mmetsp:Transcript_15440/g.32008  ORF Transcript_15440/g.32008 Transcript_15440/m.32008 type:complete len:114 (-) Transcript_15440:506-847(-)
MNGDNNRIASQHKSARFTTTAVVTIVKMETRKKAKQHKGSFPARKATNDTDRSVATSISLWMEPTVRCNATQCVVFPYPNDALHFAWRSRSTRYSVAADFVVAAAAAAAVCSK